MRYGSVSNNSVFKDVSWTSSKISLDYVELFVIFGFFLYTSLLRIFELCTLTNHFQVFLYNENFIKNYYKLKKKIEYNFKIINIDYIMYEKSFANNMCTEYRFFCWKFLTKIVRSLFLSSHTFETVFVIKLIFDTELLQWLFEPWNSIKTIFPYSETIEVSNEELVIYYHSSTNRKANFRFTPFL